MTTNGGTVNYDNMTPDQIVDAVIAEQRAKGLAQYGVPLAPNVVPNVLEALREAIDGMHYLAAEVARLNGQRCVSCRWYHQSLGCTNPNTPDVSFVDYGDPTTFGCPFHRSE
mgnify:CR=1 FL=1|jgi:hypothetical protein